MKVKFWKMHGQGNDFILIDNRDNTIREDKFNMLAKKLCERRLSIGADGLLLLSNSRKAEVKMRIFNADGSEAEMCGNGIRCLAKYCYDNKLIKVREFAVETMAGLKHVKLIVRREEPETVSVGMGKPVFERSEIPMHGEGKCIDEPLKVSGQEFRMTCLSVGNPHCVIPVDSVDDFPVQEIGPKIENNELFPNRVNVEFTQILNRQEMRVRVWERGVGETLACGTGACAAAVAGSILGRTGMEVIVHLLGGDLTIYYDRTIVMTGVAEKVFEGFVALR